MSKQLKADLSLLSVTVVWGASFVITKNALQDIQTYNFLAVRFLIAFLSSAIIFYKNMKNINKKTLLYGALIGVVLFGGYAFQTVGLNYTTASKSGFITGFSVVLVPIISALLLKKTPETSTIIGVILAITGLGLMTLNSELSLNIGDFYTLLCAFGFAFHIILVGKYTVDVDSIALAVIQIGVVGILSLIFSLSSENFFIPKSFDLWFAILITGTLATSGAYLIQNTMQKFTSPTHTALIYTGEPVFSAVFAYILLGERMATKAIVGSILILLGMILGELKLNFKNIKFKIKDDSLKSSGE
ncbi:DMT family transporter [Thermohalobacter berrensis]|uniref:Multidrug DMT transporter permease n=1 Tax=Thermohalobacter berrensis TaxID=99594 RepID=A0A419SUS8_9FIRM|nr:DMT family transporter [Thermohalobacter berrensis]RKD28967.1 multidrug DMT transporter permease [Thermohalobacter berrensis]